MRSLLAAGPGRLFLLHSLGLLAACAEPQVTEEPPGPPAAGCTADVECGPGRRCLAGSCTDEEPVSSCTFEADPACEAGTLCVASLDALCSGDQGCLAPTSCNPAPGETEGSFGCSAGEECRSGACHEGICLRLCRTAADCDGTPCLELTSPRGAHASLCLPVDGAGAFDPAHPRCDADADCAAGMICRRHSGSPYSPEAHGFCAVPDPALLAAGELCAVGNLRSDTTSTPEALAADASCQGNACENSCRSGGALVCRQPRCSQPCRGDSDCPARTTCQTFARGDDPAPVAIRSCWLPLNGCYDELDCCPGRNELGQCVDGWDAAVSHCGMLELGGRLQTLCGGAPGPVAPGEACTGNDECASGLCLQPAPAWSAAAPGMCAFICSPQQDRCPALTGEASAACTPEPVLLAGEESALPVCR